MAVSANDNMIKVMANTDGLRLLHTVDNLSSESSKVLNFFTHWIFNKQITYKPVCHSHLQPAINNIAATERPPERPASVVSIPGMVGKSNGLVPMFWSASDLTLVSNRMEIRGAWWM